MLNKKALPSMKEERAPAFAKASARQAVSEET